MAGERLPSLFRWEPGMVVVGSIGVVTDIEDGFLWLDGVLVTSIADARPNMSHAGTRGLVLEQVRAARGNPLLSTRAVIRRDGVVVWTKARRRVTPS